MPSAFVSVHVGSAGQVNLDRTLQLVKRLRSRDGGSHEIIADSETASFLGAHAKIDQVIKISDVTALEARSLDTLCLGMGYGIRGEDTSIAMRDEWPMLVHAAIKPHQAILCAERDNEGYFEWFERGQHLKDFLPVFNGIGRLLCAAHLCISVRERATVLRLSRGTLGPAKIIEDEINLLRDTYEMYLRAARTKGPPRRKAKRVVH